MLRLLALATLRRQSSASSCSVLSRSPAAAASLASSSFNASFTDSKPQGSPAAEEASSRSPSSLSAYSALENLSGAAVSGQGISPSGAEVLSLGAPQPLARCWHALSHQLPGVAPAVLVRTFQNVAHTDFGAPLSAAVGSGDVGVAGEDGGKGKETVGVEGEEDEDEEFDDDDYDDEDDDDELEDAAVSRGSADVSSVVGDAAASPPVQFQGGRWSEVGEEPGEEQDSIFLANLDEETTAQELWQAMARFGEPVYASVKVGKKAPYGFVYFKTLEGCLNALAHGKHFVKDRLVEWDMSNATADRLALRELEAVTKAKKPERVANPAPPPVQLRSRGTLSVGEHPGGKKGNGLFLAPLPEATEARDLWSVYSQFGEVEYACVLEKKSPPCGFVYFKELEALGAAVQEGELALGSEGVRGEVTRDTARRLAMRQIEVHAAASSS